MLLFQEATKTSREITEGRVRKGNYTWLPTKVDRCTFIDVQCHDWLFFFVSFFLSNIFWGVSWWFASFSRAYELFRWLSWGFKKTQSTSQTHRQKTTWSLRYVTVEEVSVPLAMEAYEWGWSAPSKQLVRHLKSRSRIERVVELPRP